MSKFLLLSLEKVRVGVSSRPLMCSATCSAKDCEGDGSASAGQGH